MSRKLIAASSLVVLALFTAFAPMRSPQGAPKGPPALWVVTLELGSKWVATKGVQEQAGFADHVTAMTQLVKDGSLLVGGPFFDSLESHKVNGALWIIHAESEAAAKKMTTTDPFVKNELLKVASVRAFAAGMGTWLPADSAKPAGH